MIKPSADQVRTLAPDASAARAGEGLAEPKRWSGTGRTETAAWGLCQGSGASPYQTTVDLGGPAYKCSCPSRKLPCKHALGLMFLVARGNIESGEPPVWVTAWLESRASRAAVAATRSATRADGSAEADPEARARRVEARERKVAAGIAELDRWLADLIRRGLDSARGEGYGFWDAMGARLVDAQAPGLGRSVRAMGSVALATDVWPHLLLERAARLHLLCQAYRRAEELPGPLRADVRSLVGWTVKEEDLDPADSVVDRWLVVGRRVDDSGQVITARTFLLGEKSQRFALHLAFGVDAAPPTVLALPGQAFRATIRFFPSGTPLRGAVQPMLEHDGEVQSIPAGLTISEMLRGHAERLAVNPFVDAWPVALRDVVPVMRGDELLARDGEGQALPVAAAWSGPRILAISGGHPATLVGEWDGGVLRPLSLLANSRLVAVDASDGNPGAGPGTFRDGVSGWRELVSAALVGTERTGKKVSLADVSTLPMLETQPAEAAILGAAAVLGARRRAGVRPAVDAEPLPAAAPDDPRAPLAGEAARLFDLVVSEFRALLPETFDLVRKTGRRLPDETLPELMTLAAGDAAVRQAVADLGGPRAAWLAEMVPALAPAMPVEAETDWDSAWEEVQGATQRANLVRSLRRIDAAAAREALARWLPDVAGSERADALEALAEALTADDESLLEAALENRRQDVRRVAAGLLAQLDGSRFASAIESRARPLLALQGRLRPGLEVKLPSLDPELEAAGFGGKPPVGLGERAWLLRQLIAHVRPSRWNEWLGVAPSELVQRALRSDEARPVLEGWIEASQRFRDGTWIAALAAEPKVSEVAQLELVRAFAALRPDQRVAVAAAAAPSVDPRTLARMALLCPPFWPPDLARPVLAVIGKLTQEQYPDQAFYDLVRAAALGLSPAQADDLASLAAFEDHPRPTVSSAIETIGLRKQIHAAFAALPPV